MGAYFLHKSHKSMLPKKYEPKQNKLWLMLSAFLHNAPLFKREMRRLKIALIIVFVAFFLLVACMLYWFITAQKPVVRTRETIANNDVYLPATDVNEMFPVEQSTKSKVVLVSTPAEDAMSAIAERNDQIQPGQTYNENGLPNGRRWLYFAEFKGNHLEALNARQQANFKLWKEMEMMSFVTRIRPMAEEIANKYKVPADVIIAQAIMESAFGTSRLAVTATNLFGHKWLKKNRGEKGIVGFVNANDDSPDDVFVQYETLWYAFNKHGKILQGYLERSTSRRFPECLCEHSSIKYATSCANGKYVRNLRNTIQSFLNKQ